jgi:hypothetical protein
MDADVPVSSPGEEFPDMSVGALDVSVVSSSTDEEEHAADEATMRIATARWSVWDMGISYIRRKTIDTAWAESQRGHVPRIFT